jgi:hypothetical protein
MKAVTTMLRHPEIDWVATEFGVSYDHAPQHHRQFGATATVRISTGGCSVQCYGLPADLRALAASLMQAADAVEQQANDRIAA